MVYFIWVFYPFLCIVCVYVLCVCDHIAAEKLFFDALRCFILNLTCKTINIYTILEYQCKFKIKNKCEYDNKHEKNTSKGRKRCDLVRFTHTQQYVFLSFVVVRFVVILSCCRAVVTAIVLLSPFQSWFYSFISHDSQYGLLVGSCFMLLLSRFVNSFVCFFLRDSFSVTLKEFVVAENTRWLYLFVCFFFSHRVHWLFHP